MHSFLPNLHAHIIIITATEEMMMMPTISRQRKRRRIRKRDLSLTFDSLKATDPVKATGQLEDNHCYK